MGGWSTQVEGRCTSTEKQTEKRKDTEETHTADSSSQNKGNVEQLGGVGERAIPDCILYNRAIQGKGPVQTRVKTVASTLLHVYSMMGTSA